MVDTRWPVIRYWLAVMGALAYLTWCAVGHAECYTIEEAPLDAECVVMRYGDARGVWLREDAAVRLRDATAERDELRVQVDAYTRVDARRAAQVVLLESAARDYRVALHEQRSATDAALEQAAESDRDAARARAWWRHPAIWFGIGVVSTGAVVTVVALR